jgi:rare lipoprotein A
MTRLDAIAIAFACALPAMITTAHAQKGLASYYHQRRRTANGEHFDPQGLTAAHRTLPFGTKVRVTCLRSGRQVIVRINDRGPFVAGRLIDLARGAARQLGMMARGTTPVRLEPID